MLITKETDYALRILRALADGNRMTAPELAANEQIPQHFAYKILKKLDKAGFVQIARGADGGYTLAADLSSVTLYRLIRAMERDAAVSACTAPGYKCQWRKAHGGELCKAHIHLAQIQQTLNRELDSHTLQHILFGS
ncbi:RrF2 family transcriptional regulator [Faecalispora anaeroviscerum]|uniref:RrF2 family transcriptional regulator n=1 Tax=Faecalispora anaeroviscerum TaxID=2991836 RepID=UPI0024BBC877|nr:Rrf2 family transcriptional regulator [Faecalispora anaeroviscerum]